MKALAVVAPAFLFSLLLAGCLQVEGSVNASVLDLGRVTVSINESLAAVSVNESAVVESIVPSNATVCVYGEKDERLAGGFFGAVTVLGKETALLVEWLDEATPSKEFSDCTVVVVSDDGVGRFLSLPHRQAVAKQVSRGAGLVVMGLGATAAGDDDSVFGWQAGLGNVMPARVDVPGSREAAALGRATVSGVLFPAATDPAFAGVELPQPLEGASVTFVLPDDESRTLAWIRQGVEPAPTAPVHPGIVVECSLGRNCVYYFSYDAFSHSPAVLRNTVRFLASESLGKFFVLRALPKN